MCVFNRHASKQQKSHRPYPKPCRFWYRDKSGVLRTNCVISSLRILYLFFSFFYDPRRKSEKRYTPRHGVPFNIPSFGGAHLRRATTAIIGSCTYIVWGVFTRARMSLRHYILSAINLTSDNREL